MVLGIFIFFLVGCVWAFICNERCYDQRARIIYIIYSKPHWELLSKKFDEVSYNNHTWKLIFFRKVKYPPEIQVLL